MPKPQLSFDPRCKELANTFIDGAKLGGPPTRNHSDDLAQVIQDAIEEWLIYEEDCCPRCGAHDSLGRAGDVEYCTHCQSPPTHGPL